MAPFKKTLILYEGSGFFPERMRLSAGASKDALVPVDFTGCSAAIASATAPANPNIGDLWVDTST